MYHPGAGRHDLHLNLVIIVPADCLASPAAVIATDSGPRLNIKTVLSAYGDFHVKDKTAVRTSYL